MARVGVPVTASALNDRLGGALLNILRGLEDGPRLKQYLDQSSDAAIATELGGGLTAADINYLKGAVNAIVDLGKIFRGEMALTQARDFRNETRQAYGLGEA